MITREQIMDKLNEYYQQVTKAYGSDRIAGVFCFGAINYGTAENISELKAIVAYVPDFEQLCIRQGFHNEQFNNHIYISDIRNEYELLRQQSHFFMQPMFTDYYIINPRYEAPVMALREKAEDIFHYNPKKRVQFAVNYALDLLDKCEYMISTKNDKYSKTIKNLLSEIARLDIAIDLYNTGVPCEFCIKLKQEYCKRYIRDIKNGKTEIDITELRGSLESALSKTSDTINPEIASFVKANLLEMGKIAMTKGQDTLLILNDLTKNERRALNYIAKEINCNEGNVSISKAIKQTQISRPCFTSMLNKLANAEIIQMENQGVKGLYIKIIDTTLKAALKEQIQMGSSI